jgi:hypothetical protein
MPVNGGMTSFVDGGHVLPQSLRRPERPAALERTLVMFRRQPVLFSDGRGSSCDSLVRRLGGALQQRDQPFMRGVSVLGL